MLRPLTRGAGGGLIVGVWYGVFECLWTAMPWSAPRDADTIWHWAFSACLIGFYGLAAMAVGLVAALVRRVVAPGRTDGDVEHGRFAGGAVAGVFAVLFTLNLNQTDGASKAIAVLIVVGLLVGSAFAAGRSGGGGLHRAPWFVPLALLGVAWLLLDLLGTQGRVIKGLAVVLLLIVCAALSAFVTLIGGGRRFGPRSTPPLGVRARQFLWPVGVAAVVLLVAFLGARPAPRMATPTTAPAPRERSNVVLVVLDTVRAQNLSLYGYERDTTPVLKRLAGQATVFRHAVAPCDVTLTTHASIFTGLYGREHGAHFNDQGLGRALDESFRTLAETLSDAGFLNVAVVSNHVFFGAGYGLEQGFHYFDARPTPQFMILHRLGHALRDKKYTLRRPLHRFLKRLVPARQLERHYRRAERINAEAFELLADAKRRDVPFFLFVNYMDAHWPYVPPAPFDTRWPGKDPGFDSEHHYQVLREVVRDQERSITSSEREHLMSQYDGGIAYQDEQLGHLVERLKRDGQYDNSLIIITSDHGEAFGERVLVEHGVGVYQDQLHVPLVIKYPDSDKGRVVDGPVSLVDLMPTVLKLLQIPIPKAVEGRSLHGDGAKPSSPVLGESYPNVAFLGDRFQRVERALYELDHKFVWSTQGKAELYNLAKDPLEKDILKAEDLAASDAERSKQLQERLTLWLKNHPPAMIRQALSDPDNIERLRSLGYVQ